MTEPTIAELSDRQRDIMLNSGDVLCDQRSGRWMIQHSPAVDVSAEVSALVDVGYLEHGNGGSYVRLTEAGRDALWQDNPGHCPGPWRIGDDAGIGVPIVSAADTTLAYVIDEDPVPRQDANARLIAAAPDMLARLLEVQANVANLAAIIAETIALATGANG